MNHTYGHIAILGAGESGMGAAQLAARVGVRAFLSEYGSLSASDKALLEKWGVEYEEGGHTLERILAADGVIKSPGIKHTTPVVQAVKAAGLPLMGEVDWATLYTKAPIVAVTGSNGKTTTANLCHHIISGEKDCVLAGNIGLSLGRALAERMKANTEDPEVIVIEVSSFQLDDARHLSPMVGILTNITPDHLDRYNYSIDEYAASKLQMLEYTKKEGFFLFCDDDPITMGHLAPHLEKGTLPNMIAFGIQEHGSEFRKAKGLNNTIEITINNEAMTIEELALQGKHNMYNSMAAGLGSTLMNIRKETIRTKLASFDALEHRLENVLNISGVEYINDSKATNVNATYYALECQMKPVVWILGGVDKGNDYNELIPLVKNKIKAIVALGVDNSKILDAFQGIVEIVDTDSMEKAVRKASRLAEKGDVVLLSPCCASFDLFENYEDRGRQFKNAIRNL
ncbi:MAG: UDP-N-acetylmuramoyl-L-alanine--D-glutamate ligase [Schleiferiaceae bacterium]|nr:UDP-N-acetylmuramoyl-L-alanine--D-glutamate ligase [Schleiferiaceae bacterium]